MFGDILSGIVEVAKAGAPILVPLAVGALTKHASRIPNDLIPVINAGVGMAMSGGDASGILNAAAATGIHQFSKLLTRKFFGNLAIGAKIGPGGRVSI